MSDILSEIRITVDDEKDYLELNQLLIDSMNVPQNRVENKEYLNTLAKDDLSGIDILVRMVGVDLIHGLTSEQVVMNRNIFGTNAMPASPKKSYFTLLLIALSDTTLLILIAAASVSFAIGKLLLLCDSHIDSHFVRIRVGRGGD